MGAPSGRDRVLRLTSSHLPVRRRVSNCAHLICSTKTAKPSDSLTSPEQPRNHSSGGTAPPGTPIFSRDNAYAMSDHDAPAADPDAAAGRPRRARLHRRRDRRRDRESRYVVGTNGRPNVGRARPRIRPPTRRDSPPPIRNPAARRPPGGASRANAAEAGTAKSAPGTPGSLQGGRPSTDRR